MSLFIFLVFTCARERRYLCFVPQNTKNNIYNSEENCFGKSIYNYNKTIQTVICCRIVLAVLWWNHYYFGSHCNKLCEKKFWNYLFFATTKDFHAFIYTYMSISLIFHMSVNNHFKPPLTHFVYVIQILNYTRGL